MAAITVPEQVVTPLPRWAPLLVALAAGVLYVVAFEAGPVSAALGQAGMFLHEVFHDGRHLLGVPCH